jgi:hypothetical protein
LASPDGNFTNKLLAFPRSHLNNFFNYLTCNSSDLTVFNVLSRFKATTSTTTTAATESLPCLNVTFKLPVPTNSTATSLATTAVSTYDH